MARGFYKIALAAEFVLLTGCTVGPKYAQPTAPVPPAYKEVGASNIDGDWKPAQPKDDLARGRWGERMNDPQLNALEAHLNVSNQNIAAAAAGVLQARAMIQSARAQY